MVVKNIQPKKPKHILRRVFIFVIATSAIGLLIFLLWPLLTYDWSAGTERVYKIKGFNTGYNYIITQKPANVIAGRPIEFIIDAEKDGHPVKNQIVGLSIFHRCAYGWQSCDVKNARPLTNNMGQVNTRFIVEGNHLSDIDYLLYLSSPTKDSYYGIYDNSIDISPVYPSWLGWIIKQ
jgi:hypothetical protein